jgi:hypothetical protein
MFQKLSQIILLKFRRVKEVFESFDGASYSLA